MKLTISGEMLDVIGVNEYNKYVTVTKSLLKKYNNIIYFFHNGIKFKDILDNRKFWFKSDDNILKDYLIIGLRLNKNNLQYIVASTEGEELIYDISTVDLYSQDITVQKQFLNIIKTFLTI